MTATVVGVDQIEKEDALRRLAEPRKQKVDFRSSQLAPDRREGDRQEQAILRTGGMQGVQVEG